MIINPITVDSWDHLTHLTNQDYSCHNYHCTMQKFPNCVTKSYCMIKRETVFVFFFYALTSIRILIFSQSPCTLG